MNIVQYDAMRVKIDEVKEACNFVPDVTTDEGYAKSKRVSLDVGKVLTLLEKTRKELKSESLEYGRKVDSESKAIAAELESFQLPHKGAYKELDKLKKEREANRKAELERRIEEIRNLPESMADSDSNGVKLALEHIQLEECLNFYEFTEQALKARNASKDALAKMFGDKLKQEQEAIELDKLRKEQADRDQKDREDAIAKAAAAEAEAKAEAAKKAELDAIEQAAEAVRQREAAEAVVVHEKEQRRVDHHQRMIKHIEDCGNGFIGGAMQSFGILFRELEEKIVIDDSFEEFQVQAKEARDAALSKLKDMQKKAGKAAEDQEELVRRREQEKSDRVEAEEATKREANRQHKGKINRKAVAALVEHCNMSEAQAKKAITAIAKKLIDSVTISY